MDLPVHVPVIRIGGMSKMEKGVIPVMLTPFTSDGKAVDFNGVRLLTEWYIASGYVETCVLWTWVQTCGRECIPPDRLLHLDVGVVCKHTCAHAEAECV